MFSRRFAGYWVSLFFGVSARRLGWRLAAGVDRAATPVGRVAVRALRALLPLERRRIPAKQRHAALGHASKARKEPDGPLPE